MLHERRNRFDVLRQIHGSIERAQQDLSGPRRADDRAGATPVPALDELRVQKRHVSSLLAARGNPRALLSR